MKQLVKRYEYEMMPSPIQNRYCMSVFGSVRFVKREILLTNEDLRSDNNQRFPRLSKGESQTMLTVYKQVWPWLEKAPSQSLQVATHEIDNAYKRAHEGLGEYPSVKKFNKKAASNRHSFQLPQPKIRQTANEQISEIYLPNYKTWIPFRMHRPFPTGAKLGAATIVKNPSGRYTVSFVVTYFSNAVLESKSQEMLGIDINIHEFVCSDGTRITIPQRLKSLDIRIRRLQKQMQRMRDTQKKDERLKRSNNHEKTRIRLAKVYEKMTRVKTDFLRKLARGLWARNKSISLETLRVKNMMRNRRLARSIAFQCWGKFVEIMKSYAFEYDKNLYQISQWFPSSKMCHKCGCLNENLTLSGREWACECDGVMMNRDLNAAINIRNEAEGGSYPRYKPVEKKASGSGHRLETSHASVKQESSRLEAA